MERPINSRVVCGSRSIPNAVARNLEAYEAAAEAEPDEPTWTVVCDSKTGQIVPLPVANCLRILRPRLPSGALRQMEQLGRADTKVIGFMLVIIQSDFAPGHGGVIIANETSRTAHST